MKYKELQNIFDEYFSLSNLGEDFSNRIGLLSMICYLYSKLKLKNPDLTYWNLIYKIGKTEVPEKYLIGLSILCESFGKNCKEFPTFGIQPKDMPKKIREILHSWMPF